MTTVAVDATTNTALETASAMTNTVASETASAMTNTVPPRTVSEGTNPAGVVADFAAAVCSPCPQGVCRGSHPLWYPPEQKEGQQITGLKVHNSLTSEKELFIPANGNNVTWYTCGPTVYDACHMGHARAYLTMDILRRIMEDYLGYDVFLQVNVTDVDDKIIARARRNKLLSDFVSSHEASAVGAEAASVLASVVAKAGEAAAAFDEKMQKKLAKLQIPIENRREEEERATLLEQHVQKLEAWGRTRAGIEAATAAEDRTVGSVCAAAAEPLADVLDAELGAGITDHAIFNAHSRRYERDFIEDMIALGIRLPDCLSRVTEYVEDIVEFVKTIVAKGFAYESNGSVYMDIGRLRGAGGGTAHDYPKLEPSKGKATAAEMAESEGTFVAEQGEKRDDADFALWKKSKGGEPWWPSPWGQGRPGWHIECSVMASDVLGSNMDIHAGGSDLKFPHHDNELAQAEAYHDCQQWVNYFFHFGHLHIKGLKMSKSLKNFITIRQALEIHSARTIRLMFLLQPWDKPMNYSDQTLEEAEKRETSFKSFFATVSQQLRENWLGRPTRWSERTTTLSDRLIQHQQQVHECLLDNFNTPGAMAALLSIVSDVNTYVVDNASIDCLLLKKAAMYVTKMLRIFGVVVQDEFGFPLGGEGGDREAQVTPMVEAMVSFRDQVRNIAKQSKPPLETLMKLCDEVRDLKMAELGVRVEDSADGARWALDDPATLKKEYEAKLAAKAEKEASKLLNRIVEKAKDLAKAKANAVPADQLLRLPPYAERYSSYSEQGKPSANAEGTPLSKAALKEVDKLHKKQGDAYTKQEEALAKKGSSVQALLSELEGELAARRAEALAMLADAAMAAALSPELRGSLEKEAAS